MRIAIPRGITRPPCMYSPARSNAFRYITSARRGITRPHVTRSAIHARGVPGSAPPQCDARRATETIRHCSGCSPRIQSCAASSKKRSGLMLRVELTLTRSRGLLSADLKALVKLMAQEKATHRRWRKRRKVTNYIDLHDLKRHFAEKPEQLKEFLAGGPEFNCPHTVADMYVMLTYTEEYPHCHLARYNPYGRFSL